MQRIMLITFIASVGIATALGVLIISTGSSSSRGIEYQILSTLGLLAASSILGFANCEVWDRRSCHPLGPIGLFITCAALGLVLVPIWADAVSPGWGGRRTWWNSHQFQSVSAIAWIVAISMVDIGLISIAQLHKRYFWLRRITVFCTVLFAAFIGLFVIDDGFLNSTLFERGIPILGILVGFGTLGIHFLHRYSNLRKLPTGDALKLRLKITCPRCMSIDALPVGRSACSKCGLKFLIEIEENTCEKCGYSLYRLESSTCPECGTPIFSNPGTVPSD